MQVSGTISGEFVHMAFGAVTCVSRFSCLHVMHYNGILRSASRLQLVVPRHRLTTLGHRAFAVIGPTVWNSLPDDLRAQQNSDCFCRHLKTFLFSQY